MLEDLIVKSKLLYVNNEVNSQYGTEVFEFEYLIIANIFGGALKLDYE